MSEKQKFLNIGRIPEAFSLWYPEGQDTLMSNESYKKRYLIFNDFSLLLELIPVISGYKADFIGWSAGFEKKIGGHVFQVFILNSTGLTAPQYLPGGDLDLFAGDFRLGFSIYRWF